MNRTRKTNAGMSASERVVSAVSTVTGREPVQLEPLYEIIDPDVLDRFVSHGPGGTGTSRIVFEWAGCEVTLSDDGFVDAHVVEPVDIPSATHRHVADD